MKNFVKTPSFLLYGLAIITKLLMYSETKDMDSLISNLIIITIVFALVLWSINKNQK